jgi:hypothetical protein
MSDSKTEDGAILTDEEIGDLTRPVQTISLGTYGEALLNKTFAFKAYFFILSAGAAAYLVSYFSGVLDTHLAYGWSQAREDYVLHQLRFMAGFFMLVSLHVWLLLQQRLDTLLISCASLQTYFQFSGTAHLISLQGAVYDTWFMVIYIFLQSIFVVLILLLLKEERASQRKAWQVQGH